MLLEKNLLDELYFGAIQVWLIMCLGNQSLLELSVMLIDFFENMITS
jgi:hypothetical protein